jgi:hypothetical protein
LTKQEINALYEQSVYEIRLRVAIQLLTIPGVTAGLALSEADRFIRVLQNEEQQELRDKYP